MNKRSENTSVLYVRNFIFGVEDSLVSTVGLLSGVAAAGMNRKGILLTGAVLIFVEAFSMAIGSLISENSAEEYVEHGEVSLRKPIRGGVVMFISYFVSGFIPLGPYLVFQAENAFSASIILSLFSLLLLGVISARFFGIGRAWKSGFRMLILGGTAVIVGIVVGQVMNFI